MRRLRTVVLVFIVLCFAASAATAAWTPTREQLRDRRQHIMHKREHKCFHTWGLLPLNRNGPLTSEQLRYKWRWWTNLGERQREREWACVRHPSRVIRSVFPDYAEAQAIKVAKCESDHGIYLNVYAKNPNSTASGLFQELSGWWAHRGSPFDPWLNTQIAYELWLGSGKSFYQHWVASVGCWG